MKTIIGEKGMLLRILSLLLLVLNVVSCTTGTVSAAKPHDKTYEWADNQPEACPFPESSEITKVVFTGRYANYTQADTWFPMWAADGNEYSPFTDGTVDGYMSVGHYTNMHKVYENKNHRTGQALMVGDDPTSLKITGLGSMSTNYDNFYPCASVIADGVWYYGHYDAFNDTGYFAPAVNEKADLTAYFMGKPADMVVSYNTSVA